MTESCDNDGAELRQIGDGLTKPRNGGTRDIKDCFPLESTNLIVGVALVSQALEGLTYGLQMLVLAEILFALPGHWY